MQPDSGNAGAEPTPQRIMQMAFGFGPTLILATAVHHRVFDLLDRGPLTPEELAQQAGVSVRGLRAIAEALVGLAFLSRQGERYALTPESQAFLVRGKPGFHGGVVEHMTGLVRQWLHLDEVVATGKPVERVNQERDGTAFFEGFVEDLFALNYPAAAALGKALPLAQGEGPYRVLDLASGSGVWGIGVAQQSPRVRVTAVDFQAVLEVTRRVATRHGFGDRFKFISGDLASAEFGSGYHLATLGHILHSEGAAASQKLIAKVHQALAPGGTIAIAEFLRSDQPPLAVMPLIFAVNMLVSTSDGDTFTFGEIGRWLTDAGFRNVRALEVPAQSPLILADKA